MLEILVDENIPFGAEAFGTLGKVTLCKGRDITSKIVRDKDCLAIRSVTKVDENLLTGSKVKFIGTATIGTDHVDEQYLKLHNIGFASAPGSNANSVAEYIVAALLVLARKYCFDLLGKSIGVIGCGNVGSLVVKKARVLGMKVMENDPPLARQTGDPCYQPLNALYSADILTFHVPLTREGMDTTYHMVDDGFISRLKDGVILLNSSRGAVVDNSALLAAMQSGKVSAAVLDVWEHEPQISPELLDAVDIGTPHIAGYSFDGKVAGTKMIYDAMCASLGVASRWEPQENMPEPPVPEIALKAGDGLYEIVKKIYDIEADDARLRKLTEFPTEKQGAYFDELRKKYPVRREFYNTRIKLQHCNGEKGTILSGLGFEVIE